jgi:hypothetical protein
MTQHARESNSLVIKPEGSTARPEMSVLDIQRYRTEVHVQGYHLRSDCALVLRTQSMFRLGVDEEEE